MHAFNLFLVAGMPMRFGARRRRFIDRQGVQVCVDARHEGRIARVGLALAPKAVTAS
jgi:hypothetical protein